MSVQVQKRLYTADDLFEINSRGEQQYELIDGELIEMTPTSFKHGKFANKIGARILAHLEEHSKDASRGEVVTETGYILQHDPDVICGPDVSYFGQDKIPLAEKQLDEGYLDFAPDLAVEIISPGDRTGKIMEKVAKYLKAGVPLVWLVYPKRKQSPYFTIMSRFLR